IAGAIRALGVLSYFLAAVDLLRPRLLCQTASGSVSFSLIRLFLQRRGEVHQVVGQRAPQRDTSRFVQAADRNLRQPPITAQVRMDRFAGRRPLPVNLLSLLSAHALLPGSYRCAISPLWFQFPPAILLRPPSFPPNAQLHLLLLLTFLLPLATVSPIH